MEKLKQMKEALVGCVQGQIYGNMDKVDAKELGEAIDMIKDLAETIYFCTITEAMEKEEKEGKEGGKGQHGMMYYNQRMMPMYHYPMEYYDPRLRERYMPNSMYAQGGGGGGSSSGGSGGSGGGSGSSGGGSGSSGGSGGSGGSRNAQGDGGYDASARGNNARGGGSRGYHEGMMPMEEPWYPYPMFAEDMMYARGGGQGGGGGRGGNRNYPPMEMIKDPKEGKSGERRKMYMEGKGMKDKSHQMKELEGYMQELTQDLTEMIQDASPEEKQLLQQKISTLATKIK